ncbi:hypothetical protein AAVH_30044, partial [Aphelenchoides avenae]
MPIFPPMTNSYTDRAVPTFQALLRPAPVDSDAVIQAFIRMQHLQQPAVSAPYGMPNLPTLPNNAPNMGLSGAPQGHQNELLLALLGGLLQQKQVELTSAYLSATSSQERKNAVAPSVAQAPACIPLNGTGALSHQQALFAAMNEVQRQLQLQQQAVEMAAASAGANRQQPAWTSTGYAKPLEAQKQKQTSAVDNRGRQHMAPPTLSPQSQQLPASVSPVPRKRRRVPQNACAFIEKRVKNEEMALPPVRQAPTMTVVSIPVSSEDEEIDVVGDEASEGVAKSDQTASLIGSPVKDMDPNSPYRHHPDNLPKRNPEAALLEDYATVYALNGLSGVNRDELRTSLERALSELPTASPPPSTDIVSNVSVKTDSAYSSLQSSRATSNSNAHDGEQVKRTVGESKWPSKVQN